MGPLLTIITITYNAGRLLQNTLESVEKAASKAPGLVFEHLIVDGASADHTLEIAESFTGRLPLRIRSEPDKGLYDAMNKGLQQASGSYVWFLNAGDEVGDEQVFTKLGPALSSDADIYYSDAVFFTSDGTILGLRSQVTPHELPSEISWRDMAMGMKICHQAFIVKRSLAPVFETDNLSADLDWEIVAMKNAGSIRFLDFALCRYLLGGVSTQKHRKSLTDRWRVLQRHFGFFTTVLNHIRMAIRGGTFLLRKGKYW